MDSSDFNELMPGNIVSIKKILSEDECKHQVENAEHSGFQPATLNLGTPIDFSF